MPNNSGMIKLVALLIAMAGLALHAQTTQPTTKPAEADSRLQAGTMAPDFRVRDRDGSELHLQSLRGKVVLLEFWATWCPPCLASVPRIKRLHDTFASQGLEVVSITTTDSKEAYEEYLKKHPNYTWHIAFDPAEEEDSIGFKLYTISGFPTFFLIDRTGKIVWSEKDVLDKERTESLFAALAAQGVK